MFLLWAQTLSKVMESYFLGNSLAVSVIRWWLSVDQVYCTGECGGLNLFTLAEESPPISKWLVY